MEILSSTVPSRATDCVHAGCDCGMRDFPQRLQSLWKGVGDTPLLQVRCRMDRAERRIRARHEAGGLTGSIEDRVVPRRNARRAVVQPCRGGHLAGA